MWLQVASKLVPGIIKTGMSIASNRRRAKEFESVAEMSIFSDDPEIMEKVDKFFNQFNNMPFWYQALFIGVVSAIYGLKGADIIKKK
jgi:hypothetical protein